VRTMTVAVASYQRRDPLLRLLRCIRDQALSQPDDWAGVDVVVVLDGSTDGSSEASALLDMPIPLSIEWQPNKGLASARNLGLHLAAGEIIWFLDDDLVPADVSVIRHRLAHEQGPSMLNLGPCTFPPDLPVPPGIRAWWEDFNTRRSLAKRLSRPDEMGVANLSGPTAMFRSVGGFDEDFVGYGMEDYELSARLLKAGAVVHFDSEAVCWHHSSVDETLNRRRRREEGRNTVVLIRKHPELASICFPTGYPTRAMHYLDKLGVRSPRGLVALSAAAAAATPVARRAGHGAAFLSDLALAASFASGIADEDPALLPLAYGRPGSPASEAPHKIA